MRVFFIILIILFILIAVTAACAVSLFVYTFVRRKMPYIEDMSSKHNRFLKNHRETIQSAINEINSLSYIRVNTVSYDGYKLSARFFENKDSEKAIILFHGYRSSAMRDYACAISMYLEEGFNVLLVDQRSHGESEGRIITFGIKERHDVLTWVDFIVDRLGRQVKILLGGVSMGAATVMMASEMNLPGNVKGIIADCGFTSPAEIIKIVSERDFNIKGWLMIGLVEPICRLVGKFSLSDSSAKRALANSDIPVLFIHGEGDRYVPCSMSIENYNAASGEKFLCTVENAGHGLSYITDKQKVTEAVKSFLLYTLSDSKNGFKI